MKKIHVFLLAGALAVIGFTARGVMAEDLVVADGKNVSIDYTLTVDGKVVDTSEGKAPLQYTQGQKKIIPGLEKQLAGMKVGEEKDVVVPPEEGYGKVDPKGLQEVQKSQMPKDLKLEPGASMEMHDATGHVFPCRIKEVKDQTIVVDFNHPLTGKELKFHVKVVDIK